MERGSVLAMVSRPISFTLLLVGLLAIAGPPLFRLVRGRRPAGAALPAA